MKRRWTIALSVAALMGLAAAPAADAATDDDDPDASATAVEVEGVATISETTASDDSATATVVRVGDETIIGGSSDGGESSGEVFDSGETELGQLTVGEWEAVTGDDGSHAESSVASATFQDEDTAQVTILRSRSEAGSDGSGTASTSAAAIRLGGQDEIRVLSTTWGKDGPSSALVRQGDDTIGEDPDGQCALEIPSILNLLCLTGSDGLGGTVAPGDHDHDEVASVLEASLGGEQELALFRAGGDPQAAPASSDDLDTAESPDPASDPAPGQDRITTAAAPGGGGELPRTGGGAVTMALGLALLGAGVLLRRARATA